ncbi:MAG: hypothetical protein ACD_3C00221G0001 [uncultured bacterium (gcode 4)]|uniref:Uncharacterized protein n=1 Tax=uncultured bacterium (gcode 4) TaxID=1234023 RepID=K2FZK0_9BACT|nr:MAG: hypothetical protein ACD_3C00221G0001 [uncultured bacterium (gcode 4)]
MSPITRNEDSEYPLNQEQKNQEKPMPKEVGEILVSTSQKAEWVMDWTHVPDEDIEVKRNALMEQLDRLSSQLAEGLEKYEVMFWEQFAYIDAAIMNVEYAGPDELQNLNSDNIEVSSLFWWFDPKNIWDTKLYIDLLKKLKEQKDVQIQAHLLGFIELLSVYVLNKDANRINFEADEFKKIVFDNPKINPNYQILLIRIFELMERQTSMMVAASEKLHSNFWNELTHEQRSDAQDIAKLFE